MLYDAHVSSRRCVSRLFNEEENFQKEDFASFHPGLGKRLFVKIKDVMHTQDLPLIHGHTKLKEAILVMSEGRLGNVMIVDNEKRLLAILSDGDLRRALMREDFSLESEAYVCV